MSLQRKKERDSSIEVYTSFDYSKHLRILFLSKNKGTNKKNLDITVRFASSSLINVLNIMLEYESMPISYGF